MTPFQCACGQRIFFQNAQCVSCGRSLGFLPARLTLAALEPAAKGTWRLAAGEDDRAYPLCRNHAEHGVCNWLVDDGEPSGLCRACRLNDTIPHLGRPENLVRWASLERAKRRLLFNLMRLGLAVDPYPPDGPGLRFAFKEDQRTNPEVSEAHVLIGHAKGLITINVAEASAPYREHARVAMNEVYRTVLGHFRHESGHYYWDRLVANTPWLEPCRAAFGDDREDYAAALERYYAEGPNPQWAQRYISAYAQSHPMEDFAECWAHYLHMVDTLETAQALGAVPGEGLAGGFDEWLAEWVNLTVLLNELNRSMGLRDAYPFVLSEPVGEKLRFIHRLVSAAARTTGSTAARETRGSSSRSSSAADR